MFAEGLLLELDFISEKMEFYSSNYETIFHKTEREQDEEAVMRRPELYCKKTMNEDIGNYLVQKV